MGRRSSPNARFPCLNLLLTFLFASLISSSILFLKNSNSYPFHSKSSLCSSHHLSSSKKFESFEERRELYDSIQRDFENYGPVFLSHGETSQSMKFSDIFSLDKGIIKPILKRANPAVRAIVFHLNKKYSKWIHKTVKEELDVYFDEGVWYQDTNVFHMSLFHASHHITPTLASPSQLLSELRAVEAVAKNKLNELNKVNKLNELKSNCLKLYIDRIVLTHTGVLLAFWQPFEGYDPKFIRQILNHSLPYSPSKQLYNSSMLHTSLARILLPPRNSDGNSKQTLHILKTMVANLNSKLCSFEAQVDELWYVEEHDLLALALQGNMTVYPFKMPCFHVS